MKVEIGETSWPKAEFIAGHLYEWRNKVGEEPRLCVSQRHTDDLVLVNVKNGQWCSQCTDMYANQYRDVTDQFILSRVHSLV